MAAYVIRERSDSAGEPAMIFGVAKAGPKTTRAQRVPWLPENGIGSPDGLSLFNLKNVEIT